MEYNFAEIEKKWQAQWNAHSLYKVSNDSNKPAFYVLDMFPYPSGTGLHVGHPLGYIASDIYARFKRLKGFNVLHPMGYDAFGLPAEQFAIEHGIHPAVSTEENIMNFRRQLDKIGFSFDWTRQVKTSDPAYYRWTQWIFLQLFNSWYNRETQKAEGIETLVAIFEKSGNASTLRLRAGREFSAADWKGYDERKKREVLMEWRLAYCSYGEVNWCEALGTVLANDEVINGVSERGGYPVVKKKLRQWYLRITEYADRLLEGLERIEFSESMKEMQSNWIGKSFGAEMEFRVSLNPAPFSETSRPAGGPTPGPSETSPPAPLQGRVEVDSEPGYYTNTVDEWKAVNEFAKENRKKSTHGEDKLWQELRDRKLDNQKFRRQHAVAGFIPDFVCIEKKLIVEIDGGYHNIAEQKNLDGQRTKWLVENGYKIIRFTNEEVIENLPGVLEEIRKSLSEKNLNEASGSPLLWRGVRGEVSLPEEQEKGLGDEASLKVYTTRPDTIFGVDFMVVSPEHELLEHMTSPAQKQVVDEYLKYVKSRSERERMAEKKITGCFTGAYAINPFNERKIPVWVSEYVLAGYGTGAIMGVPCGDERDFKFAQHFGIPITNIIGSYYNGKEANSTKDAILEHSDFLNGILMKDAIEIVINKIESLGIGRRKVNYKMRDAAFSRQRYWGEPFPIIWKEGIAYPLSEKELPLQLPEVETYKPGPEGEGPLANLIEWVDLSKSFGNDKGTVLRETNTMPGYAGSSWYFFRYMDPENVKEFCSRKASDYWGQVDLYIGGTEHAVGHLLYSRMWTKVLFDLGFVAIDEPFKKLVNQGMIQGVSQLAFKAVVNSNTLRHLRNYRGQIRDLFGTKDMNHYFSADYLPSDVDLLQKHVPISYVDSNKLDVKKFYEEWAREEDSIFYCKDGYFLDGAWHDEDGKLSDAKTFLTTSEVEKMSKSKFNTVNPDDLVKKYGADTFRMYEMFLGPVEQSKPWDTKGIEGVHRFLKKLWRLFYDETRGKIWTDEKPTDAEWKVLHKTIRKIEEDTERFSFNTAVSAFMIAVNELHDLKCHKREILEPLLITLAPYAPHIAEELFHLLNQLDAGAKPGQFILNRPFPHFDRRWLVESSKNYPVAINGKTRTELSIGLDASQEQVEALILSNETVQKWLEGKPPKKIIYVKNKMINVVV